MNTFSTHIRRSIRYWAAFWTLQAGCILVAGFLYASRAHAADESDTAVWVSRIVSIQGSVLVRRSGDTDWQPVQLNDTFFIGDQIRVQVNSRAGIRLSNDAVLRLDQNTTLVFIEIETQTTFVYRLVKGAVQFFSHWPRSLRILTPFVNGVVSGTEFFVRVDDDQTRIDLFEGRILAENTFGSLQLAAGESVTAEAGHAPQRQILVRPMDGVQWAMYYPPILAWGGNGGSPDIGDTAALVNQGRISDALTRLEALGPQVQNARFFVFRAALRLHVGRVVEAEADIGLALELDPADGDALALQAVIAVVQNRKTDALRDAREAVRLDPRSASTHIALSYALQADFDLTGALQAARDAVTQAPGNYVAWARLAELRLSVGELDQGVAAARKAVDLNPRAAHAHTTLGFAHLTQIQTEKARKAFDKAIALDSAAPLPRLGLGLATIRDGDLEQGRAQIEIAASLDPANALIRSYLGKAYFEEKRGPLDERQFEIAKALDPNDPTPWFYDAIRKQILNRPGEALQDLQRSIELNDNRAVYRSRLFLDQDLAARSASLGRIFNDLDFQHLALNEGYKSLTADATNHSAHRLLADNYAAKPRHEIARVSELLQSQLLQPINILPVQPYLAESNLSILSCAGPSSPSLYEYTPLFSRNRLAFQAGVITGSNSTLGDEIVQSGMWGRYSYSLGQFYYETDGFRENNGQTHNIYNAFVQMSVSPETSIQAEYRYKDLENGDLELRLDPENYYPSYRYDEKIQTFRFGMRKSFFPHSTLIASAIYQLEDYTYTDADYKNDNEEDGVLLELRYLLSYEFIQLSLGGGYFESDFTFIDNYDPGSIVKSKYNNIYAYLSISYPKSITWLLGGSGESSKIESTNRDQFNPKMGVHWNLTSRTTLRAAAFRTLQRDIISSQTIEPVQVAGFNQFFEDGVGTDAWNYGVGIDQMFSNFLYGGLDILNRELDVPYLDIFTGDRFSADWKEYMWRAYLNLILLSNLSISVDLQYEQLNRDHEFVGSNLFARLETYRLPISFNYFHDSGFSFHFKTTYTDQQGEFGDPVFEDLVSNGDHFWVADASVRYQLPNRLGFFTIVAKNIFNSSFRFQDTDPANPQIYPEPYYFARFEFGF